jgi:hypothetical protein
MIIRIKDLLLLSLLASPPIAVAGPPAGHPGNGNQGAHGNAGAAHGNAGNEHDQDQGPGSPGRGRNEHGNRNDNEGDNEGGNVGHIAGSGRGNSQGALHANNHAIEAVCRHKAAAAHSALGVRCGDITISRDPRTGATNYSQGDVSNAPLASSSTVQQSGKIKRKP